MVVAVEVGVVTTQAPPLVALRFLEVPEVLAETILLQSASQVYNPVVEEVVGAQKSLEVR